MKIFSLLSMLLMTFSLMAQEVAVMQAPIYFQDLVRGRAEAIVAKDWSIYTSAAADFVAAEDQAYQNLADNEFKALSDLQTSVGTFEEALSAQTRERDRFRDKVRRFQQTVDLYKSGEGYTGLLEKAQNKYQAAIDARLAWVRDNGDQVTQSRSRFSVGGFDFGGSVTEQNPKYTKLLAVEKDAKDLLASTEKLKGEAEAKLTANADELQQAQTAVEETNTVLAAARQDLETAQQGYDAALAKMENDLGKSYQDVERTKAKRIWGDAEKEFNAIEQAFNATLQSAAIATLDSHLLFAQAETALATYGAQKRDNEAKQRLFGIENQIFTDAMKNTPFGIFVMGQAEALAQRIQALEEKSGGGIADLGPTPNCEQWNSCQERFQAEILERAVDSTGREGEVPAGDMPGAGGSAPQAGSEK